MAGVSYPNDSAYNRTPKDLPPGDSPKTNKASAPAQEAPEENEKGEASVFSDEWLLEKAEEIHKKATSYLDANITNTWERNLAHFNGEHPPGSVYRRNDFRRSRTFRPKTRANVKQQESALANAAFSTLNIVDVRPVNPKDPQQQIAAGVRRALLEHRLSYRMPWFLTVQGAFQSTKVYGICISEQYWDYHEDTDVVPVQDDMGAPVRDEQGFAMGREEVVVRRDKLCCDLIEPENFLFDPMCDWRNPADTSPFIVRKYPMFVGDALEMMQRADPKTGRSAWRKYEMDDLLGTSREFYGRTRQAREGRQRVDPSDLDRGNEFSSVWAHRNIIRVNGVDYEYWTMGTELLLTDPVPLRELHPWLREEERPFVVGFSSVEAFRNYPSGDVEQSGPLQSEINLVANQRLDNVKLVLNKRYFVRRGSQVDLDALIRNTPGGGVMMNDTEKDVNVLNTPDVTSSSYQEQGVLSQEFDDLVGGFNPAQQQQSSVAGQQMGAATAGAVNDYGIKVFIETWYEPVLRQLDRLIGVYETDETLIQIAGDESQAFDRMGSGQIPDSVFLENLNVHVDIGMGNTDPMRKAERLIFAATQTAQLPGMAERIKGKPLADAIFGAVGYRDSSTFVMTDEEFSQYMQENPPGPTEIDVKMRELDIRDETEAARDERERLKLQIEEEISREQVMAKQDEIIAKQDMKLDELMNQLNMARMSDKTTRDTEALRAAQQRTQNNLSGGGKGEVSGNSKGNR
jgi:hypothetical protein